MEHIKLGTVEARFADIIWEKEPISSGELVKICQEKLEWKKSTTYTVLKKLCERGIFKNDGGVVRSVLSRDQFNAAQSEQFVDDNLAGSLPAFIAAFTSRNKLTEKEIAQIKKLIENSGQED